MTLSILNPANQRCQRMRIEAEILFAQRPSHAPLIFRKQRLFIDSGVIEAGCRTIIGSRLKESGTFWTLRGANAILALRAKPPQWAVRTILAEHFGAA